MFSVDLPRARRAGRRRSRWSWSSSGSRSLPRVRRRTGYKDDFLLIAHWFPKLGVYEGDRGWNCHQFHLNTEFYADFGTYDVTLDLPLEYAGNVVAAPACKVDERGAPAAASRRRSSRLQPEDRERDPDAARGSSARLVHDFAWTADRATSWSTRGPTAPSASPSGPSGYEDEVEAMRRLRRSDRTSTSTLRDVDVTVLIQPERESGRPRATTAPPAAALFFYGLWFGEYPYQHVTVVDPAWGARAAGGMEYPTLFTCGTRLFTTEDMYVPESVTVHEAGHQFWYGLVGNNEFEAAWIDEGFNSYTDSEVLFRAYGNRARSTTYYALGTSRSSTACGSRDAAPGGNDAADAVRVGEEAHLDPAALRTDGRSS